MTDAYEYQSFYLDIEDCHIIDCRDISGTRCYLDDAAYKAVCKKIAAFSAIDEIHFIDSGNYHYLSLLWLEKISCDFNLILFDHHPDNQPPSFGDIISCGGWVRDALIRQPHLKNVFTYGLSDEIAIEDLPHDLPIYISIDKDILSPDYCISDWDQGDIRLDTLINMLSSLFKNHTVLGVDICGDSGQYAQDAASINNLTNATIFDFLRQNF